MFGQYGGGRQHGGRVRGAQGYSDLIYTLNLLIQFYNGLVDSINITIVRTFGLKETEYNRNIIGNKILMANMVKSIMMEQTGGKRKSRRRHRQSKRKSRKHK